MSDGFIQLPADSNGKKIDTSDLVVGGSTSVHRERYVAADPENATGLAPVTSSGGLTVHVTNPSTAVTVNVSTAVTVTNISTAVTVTNPSTAVTVTNPSTAVTVTNPSTEVNTLSSGPVLISGTVNVVSASSGLVQISGTPLVLTASSGYIVRSLSSGIVTLSSPTSLSSGIVTLSSVPTVTATGPTTITSGLITLTSDGITQAIVTGSSGVAALVSSGGSLQVITTASASGSTAVNLLTTGNVAYPVSSSYGLITQHIGSLTSSRLIIATTASKISSAPGLLFSLEAMSTAVAAGGAYLRLYDLTTGNATSSSSAGLAGASRLLRIASSVAGMPAQTSYTWPHGIKFATACSFDIVLNATSTATQLAGWVSAQYSS